MSWRVEFNMLKLKIYRNIIIYNCIAYCRKIMDKFQSIVPDDRMIATGLAIGGGGGGGYMEVEK